MSATNDANFDCAFVENALVFNVPKSGPPVAPPSEENRALEGPDLGEPHGSTGLDC